MKKGFLVAASVAALCACSGRELVGADAAARARVFAAGVDTDRLMADVNTLADSHRLDAPIDCSHIDLTGIDRAPIPLPYCNLSRERTRALLRERFTALGFNVSSQDSDGPDYPSSNLIAEIPGTEHPEEIVIVAAHYDAFHQGADDNSSGVSAVLELARLVSGHRFARTVRFVGFDLEELGVIGSVRYVEARKKEKLVVALVYDCIGYRDRHVGSQGMVPGFPVPPTGDFIAAIANDASRARLQELLVLGGQLGTAPVRGVVASGEGATPASGQLLRSDHSPFWYAGLSSIFVTDTANLRNPNYHRDTDLPETLDPDFLGDVTRLSTASLSVWAGGPQP